VIVAVEVGQLEIVQEFLQESCDVNNYYQEKVLHIVLMSSQKVNINPQVHGRSSSVLHIAAEKGFTEIYELLSDPTVCEIDTTLRDKVSMSSTTSLIYKSPNFRRKT
jgi:hypothetical protein